MIQPATDRLATLLRDARTGDILPPATVDVGGARRLDATAFVLPGSGRLDAYLAALSGAERDFAAWDGRVVVLGPNRAPRHRLVIVDRYGQVYDVVEGADAEVLPSAAALEEWFKFLATACPECGVIDDPRERSWTP